MGKSFHGAARGLPGRDAAPGRAGYNLSMTRDQRNLTSDPAAERIAVRRPSEDEVRAEDARSGGDPAGAPRSLRAVELRPDDESISSNDEWDDPERL